MTFSNEPIVSHSEKRFWPALSNSLKAGGSIPEPMGCVVHIIQGVEGPLIFILLSARFRSTVPLASAVSYFPFSPMIP